MKSATDSYTAEVVDVLNEVAEFLGDYSDVLDGDEGHPRPNKAMSLLSEVELMLHKLKRVDGPKTPPDDIADTLKLLRAKSKDKSEFADWILNYWSLGDEHRFSVHAYVFKGMDIEGYVRKWTERTHATGERHE